MMDPEAQIEIHQDQKGERAIKVDKIISSTSLENLDNPTAGNSRVDTTQSSRHQDTERKGTETVQSVLGKLKNIRGQMNNITNQFYNIDEAIGKSNRTSKQSHRQSKGSETKGNSGVDSWTELQTNYNIAKKLKEGQQ